MRPIIGTARHPKVSDDPNWRNSACGCGGLEGLSHRGIMAAPLPQSPLEQESQAKCMKYLNQNALRCVFISHFLPVGHI